MSKPTIHELEAILESDEPTRVRIEPDGSITTEPDCEQETPIDKRILAAEAAMQERCAKENEGRARRLGTAAENQDEPTRSQLLSAKMYLANAAAAIRALGAEERKAERPNDPDDVPPFI